MFITLALSLSELGLLSTRLGCDGLTSQVPSRLVPKCACGNLSCHKSQHKTLSCVWHVCNCSLLDPTDWTVRIPPICKFILITQSNLTREDVFIKWGWNEVLCHLVRLSRTECTVRVMSLSLEFGSWFISIPRPFLSEGWNQGFVHAIQALYWAKPPAQSCEISPYTKIPWGMKPFKVDHEINWTSQGIGWHLSAVECI